MNMTQVYFHCSTCLSRRCLSAAPDHPVWSLLRKYGFDMLMHAKSMLISPPDVAIKHLFPPFSPEKNADLKIWSEY